VQRENFSRSTSLFHSLVPDGVFMPWAGGVRFEPLPPPTQTEVEKQGPITAPGGSIDTLLAGVELL
jgi:hypothetical protein